MTDFEHGVVQIPYDLAVDPQARNRVLDMPADVRGELELRLVEGDKLVVTEEHVSSLAEAEDLRSEENQRWLARLAVNSSLYFINAISQNPSIKLTPAVMVDEAWHGFILFTEEYARYCEAIGGAFVHHRPTRRGEAPDPEVLSSEETYKFLEDGGFRPHSLVWDVRSRGGCCGGH